VTPRISGVRPPRRPPTSTLEEFRQDGDYAPIESRAFWRWTTHGALEEGAETASWLPEEEYRVLSKGASGGGFFVPTDLAESVFAAARAASAVGQVAQEFLTTSGASLNVGLAGTHGTASWIAESGSFTPSDETITQATLGAFKAGTKIIASEELIADEAVELDAYLAVELGGRIGTLENNAFTVGDGSGKPLGIVHASSPYTVVTAATGSSTTYKLADLKSVFKALPLAYRAEATWQINGDDFAELAALVDTAGALVLPSLQNDPPSLFGRPIVLNTDLPTPAANAKSLAVGNWKLAYGVRRVNGIRPQRQEEIHSDAGQVGFRSISRVDGRALLSDAARILAHSAS
jgi:HK97 family phage major capsid protein